MILKWIGKFVNTMLDRIVSVLGAIAFSQLPQLMMQYSRVLEGALAEAQKNILLSKAKAAELGLSLKEFIEAHLRNPDPIFQKSGEVYQQSLLRHNEYKDALQALGDASIWNKPFVFMQHVDSSLFTKMNFEPGVPLSIEGGVYALAGILCALAFYHGILKLPVRLLTKNEKKKSQKPNEKSNPY